MVVITYKIWLSRPTGNVIVMACDLNTTRKIITLANRFDMVSGRFLWLWLDLKAELRASEPNLISHVVHGNRAPITGNENAPQLKAPEEKTNLLHETSGQSLHVLPNLDNDIRLLQDYWLRKEHVLRKRQAKELHFEEESERDRRVEKTANPRNFMPAGMLALRPASIKIAGTDAVLGRVVKDMSQALDDSISEARSRLGRLRDAQIKEYFVPECYGSVSAKFFANEPRENVSQTIARKMRRSMRQISKEKAEFHLLNLQGIAFPGNKTQLR